MKFNKSQLQAIIDDQSSQWGISEKNLTKALNEIVSFEKGRNKQKSDQIYSKVVLREYMKKIHEKDRKKFVETGDIKYLRKVYEVFPVGKEGKQDISELMSWSDAFKDKRVMWDLVAGRQESGAARAAGAVGTMLAFGKLARSLSN